MMIFHNRVVRAALGCGKRLLRWTQSWGLLCEINEATEPPNDLFGEPR